MMKRTLILLVITFIISCSRKSETNNINDLRLEIEKFNKAFEEVDIEKLDQLITENYVHTNSSWKAFGKNEWLEYLEKRRIRIEEGELEINKYEMADLNIEMYGSSAFITGKIVMYGIENGEPFQREIRVSNFWVVDEGKWKRAGFHDTRIE